MANTIDASHANGRAYSNSFTLAAAASDSMDVIDAKDADYYTIYASGSAGNLTLTIQGSNDNTNFFTIATGSGAQTSLQNGEWNAEYLKVTVTNTHGSEQTITTRVRLRKRYC